MLFQNPEPEHVVKSNYLGRNTPNLAVPKEQLQESIEILYQFISIDPDNIDSIDSLKQIVLKVGPAIKNFIIQFGDIEVGYVTRIDKQIRKRAKNLRQSGDPLWKNVHKASFIKENIFTNRIVINNDDGSITETMVYGKKAHGTDNIRTVVIENKTITGANGETVRANLIGNFPLIDLSGIENQIYSFSKEFGYINPFAASNVDNKVSYQNYIIVMQKLVRDVLKASESAERDM